MGGSRLTAAPASRRAAARAMTAHRGQGVPTTAFTLAAASTREVEEFHRAKNSASGRPATLSVMHWSPEHHPRPPREDRRRWGRLVSVPVVAADNNDPRPPHPQ